MTTKEKNKLSSFFSRIVVALDDSRESEAALETAVRLAAALKREILGVFVEDENLYSLSQLPSSFEYRWGSRRSSGMNTDVMRAALRVQAERTRQRLLSISRTAQVVCHFQVSRGRVADELKRKIEEHDLLILGRTGRSLRLRKRLGSTAHDLCQGSHPSLLLVRSLPRHPSLLMLVHDEEQQTTAIGLASTVRSSDQVEISVVTPSGSGKAPTQDDLERVLKRQKGIIISRFPDELCKFPALEQFLREVDAHVLLFRSA